MSLSLFWNGDIFGIEKKLLDYYYRCMSLYYNIYRRRYGKKILELLKIYINFKWKDYLILVKVKIFF